MRDENSGITIRLGKFQAHHCAGVDCCLQFEDLVKTFCLCLQEFLSRHLDYKLHSGVSVVLLVITGKKKKFQNLCAALFFFVVAESKISVGIN